MTGEQRPNACPRCATPLQAGLYHEVAVARCRGCDGSLVGRHELQRLLGKLTADLTAQKVDLDGTIQPVAPLEGTLPCPRCGAAMERFRYLEATNVQPHACNACELLWVTPAELLTMCCLFQLAERQAATMDEELAELQDRSVERFMPPPAYVNLRTFQMGSGLVDAALLLSELLWKL